MSRFISALGPDLEPEDPRVKYWRSTRTFSDALTESEQILLSLDRTDLTTAIYRLSYDPAKDLFFSWRQTDAERLGTQIDPADSTTTHLAYEIYTAPASLLLSAEGQRIVNQEIDKIA